jgi:3-(3-hydroxy-phenyl)propionate hydroxylase
MIFKRGTDVLVVGAGPVGLLAASTLAKEGVGVRIVDEEWRTGTHSYALALHPSTIRILEDLDIPGAGLERGRTVEAISFYEGAERHAEARLDGLPSERPVVVLPQSDLEELLEDALRERRVPVRWNHRLSAFESGDDRVVARLDRLEKSSSGYAVSGTEWSIEGSSTTAAKMLLGADGHRSSVRRILDIGFPVVRRPEVYAVFEIESRYAMPPELRVVLDEDVTSALWPLPGGRYRWSFQLREEDLQAPERAKGRLAVQVGMSAFPHVSREALEALLRERAPWFDVPVGEIRWSLLVRFEHRLAERLGSGRVWLAGDAAHVTGPVGMWSMNHGAREVVDLARRMAATLAGGEADLETYENETRATWCGLLGLEGAPRAAEDADPWVAERADRILGCLPVSGEDLREAAGRLKLLPPD